jgi:hypothetical protein
MESIKTITEFSEKLPRQFNDACSITQNMSTLVKIYKNIKLFNRVKRAKCTIYTELVRALCAVDEAESMILIHFTDIDLYCVFTNDDYLDLATNIQGDVEDQLYGVNIYQVVLSGKRQKLVFACTDPEYFDKLQRYACDCFNKPTSASANEVMVDIVTNDEKEIFDSYNKLYDFIRSRNDLPCCDAMKPIQLMRDISYQHRRYSCNDTLSALTMDRLVGLLRSAVIVIGDNNVVNAINGDNNRINTGPNKAAVARRWIESHPPGGEKTGDYFAQYKDSIDDHLSIHAFAKLITSMGYRQRRTGTFCTWTK